MDGETKVSPEYNIFRFEDSTTIYTCADPKFDTTGLIQNLTVQSDAVPKPTIPRGLQIANLNYVDSKIASGATNAYSKTEDLNLTNTYRVKNMIDPTNAKDAVTKSYCDSNKTSSDGTGVWLGSLVGGVGGALAGAITSGIFSAAGNGLAGVG
jgi:hypothetical protein